MNVHTLNCWYPQRKLPTNQKCFWRMFKYFSFCTSVIMSVFWSYILVNKMSFDMLCYWEYHLLKSKVIGIIHQKCLCHVSLQIINQRSMYLLWSFAKQHWLDNDGRDLHIWYHNEWHCMLVLLRAISSLLWETLLWYTLTDQIRFCWSIS